MLIILGRYILSDAFVQFLNFILQHYGNFLLVIFESVFPLFGLHSLTFFLNVQMQIVFYSPVDFTKNILIYLMEIKRSSALNILFSDTFILTLLNSLANHIFFYILFLSFGSFSLIGAIYLHCFCLFIFLLIHSQYKFKFYTIVMT